MTDVNAVLLISSSCPHCASVLQGLSELIKSGVIARLEVINITEAPEFMQQYPVRSVPFLGIGAFEFEGLQSVSEMKFWAEQAGTQAGMVRYFNEALKSGGLHKVLKLLRQDSTQFSALFTLMQDPATDLAVRVGIGAIIEEYEASPELLAQIEHLIKLVDHPDSRVRLDACHYLALTHSPRAIPAVESLLDDENTEVREVARESVEALRQQQGA